MIIVAFSTKKLLILRNQLYFSRIFCQCVLNNAYKSISINLFIYSEQNEKNTASIVKGSTCKILEKTTRLIELQLLSFFKDTVM